MVGEAGKPDESLGIAATEISCPPVVDAVDHAPGLGITKKFRPEGEAVDHLGIDAVQVLVLDPELRDGGVIDALGRILEEAGLGHPLVPGHHPRVCLLGAQDSDQAQLILAGPPYQALLRIYDPGHLVLEVSRGVGYEDIVGHPGQVYVGICGDYAVFHLLSSSDAGISLNMRLQDVTKLLCPGTFAYEYAASDSPLEVGA